MPGIGQTEDSKIDIMPFPELFKVSQSDFLILQFLTETICMVVNICNVGVYEPPVQIVLLTCVFECIVVKDECISIILFILMDPTGIEMSQHSSSSMMGIIAQCGLNNPDIRSVDVILVQRHRM